MNLVAGLIILHRYAYQYLYQVFRIFLIFMTSIIIAHAIHSGTVDASVWNTPIWDAYKHFAESDLADRNFIHNRINSTYHRSMLIKSTNTKMRE